MKRQIITIDEEKCNGCGLCVPNCPEGAIQIIDGKAKVVSDLYCDGLGACLGHCPLGALKIEEREAEPYDEFAVMDNVVKEGDDVIIEHLEHLQDHGQTEFYNQALQYLKEKGYDMTKFTAKPQQEKPAAAHHHGHGGGGCPGSLARQFAPKAQENDSKSGDTSSQLRQWPIQVHLFNPMAPYFPGSDFLLAADCTAFSFGAFHGDFLKGKTLGIACPKLDSNKEIYVEKLIALIDDAKINTLTVAIMEVPCCGGLVAIAQEAVAKASRKVPMKVITLGIQGEKLSENWL